MCSFPITTWSLTSATDEFSDNPFCLQTSHSFLLLIRNLKKHTHQKHFREANECRHKEILAMEKEQHHQGTMSSFISS